MEDKSKRYLSLVRPEDRTDAEEDQTTPNCCKTKLDFKFRGAWACVGEIMAKHHFRHRQGRVYWMPKGANAEEIEVTPDWLDTRARRYAARKKIELKNVPKNWAAQALQNWDVLAAIRCDVIWGKEDDLPALKVIAFELARRGCYLRGGRLNMVVEYRRDGKIALEEINAEGLRTALSEFRIYVGSMVETDESKENRKEARKEKDLEPPKEYGFRAEPVSQDRAKLIYASATVRTALPPIDRLNKLRLPVRREDGRVVLLPVGYDRQSRTLTLNEFEYETDMPVQFARELLKSLYSEFPYADNDATSLGIGYSVALMGEQLLPHGALFPGLAVVGNTVGAGKTRFGKLAALPLGVAPKIDMPSGMDEMSKTTHAMLRGGQTLAFFDNSVRRVSGGPIEAAMTTFVHDKRVLVSSKMGGALEGAMKIIITGVDLRLDLGVARRFRTVRLKSNEENPEMREFKNELNDSAMFGLRRQYCAAIWALIRDWVKSGQKEMVVRKHMPEDYRSWYALAGSVVVHAGFSDLALVNDRKANDEREYVVELLKAMADPVALKMVAEEDCDAAARGEWDTRNLVKLAEKRELFVDALTNARSPKSAQTILGRILARWIDRPCGGQVLRYRRVRSSIYRVESTNAQKLAA